MIIDGKFIAENIQIEIKQRIQQLKDSKPCLAVILVGSHPASMIYVKKKTKACCEVGIDSLQLDFSSAISENELIKEIIKLNQNSKVHGILIQLPLPSHINTLNVINKISPQKDVDGLHPLNVGKMLLGESDAFFPCTPLGIKVLLEQTKIDITGKHVVIIGRSNLVGKPLAAILMQNALGANATVTLIHSRSSNVKELCLIADVIIAAIGQPHFIKQDMVKEGAIVIDVGINKLNDATQKSGYKIVGDVDFENVKNKCAFITPVPGGVGPMTIAMLLSNTFKSFMHSNN